MFGQRGGETVGLRWLPQPEVTGRAWTDSPGATEVVSARAWHRARAIRVSPSSEPHSQKQGPFSPLCGQTMLLWFGHRKPPCDPKPVTTPFWVSVSSSVKGGEGWSQPSRSLPAGPAQHRGRSVMAESLSSLGPLSPRSIPALGNYLLTNTE